MTFGGPMMRPPDRRAGPAALSWSALDPWLPVALICAAIAPVTMGVENEVPLHCARPSEVAHVATPFVAGSLQTYLPSGRR